MIDRLRHVLGWLAYQFAPKSPVRAGECEARLTLYPSRHRNVDVMAASSKSPGAVSPARGAIGGSASNDSAE